MGKSHSVSVLHFPSGRGKLRSGVFSEEVNKSGKPLSRNWDLLYRLSCRPEGDLGTRLLGGRAALARQVLKKICEIGVGFSFAAFGLPTSQGQIGRASC